MNSIQLKALDTLFFKDGKPFSMEEESWAQGVFPPYPTVMYGMLRSLWFAGNLDMLAGANELGDPSMNLKICGYLPALNGLPAFPIPQDLYGDKCEKEDKAVPYQLRNCNPDIISEYPLPCLLHTDVTKVEALGGKALFSETEFRNYLDGNATEFSYAKISDYTHEEPKIGIGRNPETRTASEGQLYRLGMKRLAKKNCDGGINQMSFLLQFEGLEIPQGQLNLTRFGAENKAAEYCQYEGFPNIDLMPSLAANRFKIYLATPAVFEEGSYPTKWFQDHGLKLIAAAIGKPECIGGFDMKAKKPKAMSKAVPAGSVYYVEMLEGKSTEQVKTLLHQKSIYSLAPLNDEHARNYSREGFGISYIGNIHPKNQE